jgi:hypothetical protein
VKYKLSNFVKISLSLVIGSSALFYSVASAAAYYGVGTSSNPYRITDCTDLQNINNNLSADYIIVANINCSGVSFSEIANGSDFSGTLNGQDHTIINLNISQNAIFYETSNATIENLTIGSGSTVNNPATNGYSGGLIGYANNTTITNVHSSQTITKSGEYGYLGGLVGYLTGTSTISQSSFTGTINATNVYDQDIGGIVGADDSSNPVTDSFVSGAINSSAGGFDFNLGGVVGLQESGTISNVYSSASINENTGSTYTDVGGVEGNLAGGSITNAFSASTLSGSVGSYSYVGGFFGIENSSLSNIYFDAYLAGTNDCSGSGVNCNFENIGNANPNYFKDNNANGPFSSWNFTNTWSTTSNYPTLDDIALFNAPYGIPNSGDANGDGTQDSYQAFIGSIEGSNNVWATVELPLNNECSVGNLASSTGATYSNYSPETNLISYDAYCSSTGLSVPVTIIFNTELDTSKAVLLYYNPNSNSYSVVSNAVFGTTVVGGVTETTVTYTVTDGGAYDDNGTVDGLIIDPVEIAIPSSSSSSSTPDTGYGKPARYTAAYTLLSVSLALIIIGTTALFIKKRPHQVK